MNVTSIRQRKPLPPDSTSSGSLHLRKLLRTVYSRKMASETFLSRANTEFALDLFQKFSEGNMTGNMWFSSFSIFAALAMVRLGARGNTSAQISQFFKAQSDEDDVDASFAQLLLDLKKPDASYALSVANRLYGEKTFTFKADFVSDTEKYYSARFEAVDFINKTDESRISINQWVEEQTQGKITDLLPSGAVDGSTRLVLVNAIYFKAKWENRFKKYDTYDADFRLNKNDTKTVKMMQQTEDFSISSNDEAKCQILEMPYEGGDMSLIIMLPYDIEDDTTGLEKLERELTYDKFKQWTGKNVMQTKLVRVSLPRFKMEQSFDLKEVLMSLGMVDAFDESKSDFSGMSDVNLVVSKAVHKAFMEVNEEGTEAAASTGVTFVLTSGDMYLTEPETFKADHPFLVFIRHNPSNSVLFAGRFCSPE